MEEWRIPERRTSRYKGPNVGTSLEYLRNGQKPRDKGRKWPKKWSWREAGRHCRVL